MGLPIGITYLALIGGLIGLIILVEWLLCKAWIAIQKQRGNFDG